MERKTNSVFGANQSLMSVLHPWIRKLKRHIGMVHIDRTVPEATDSLQTKSWQKGLWAKAGEQGVLNTLGTSRQKCKSKGSDFNRLLHGLSLEIFVISATWWWSPVDSGLLGFRLLQASVIQTPRPAMLGLWIETPQRKLKLCKDTECHSWNSSKG